MKRILGIDYGDVRTGIAVSDMLGMMACGVGTFKAESDAELLAIIMEKARYYDISHFVMGNPINMNGTIGERSEKVKAFAALLEAESALAVEFVDERMTTMEAHRYLNVSNTRGKKRKNVVDTLSAEIILQTYLDSPASQKYRK